MVTITGDELQKQFGRYRELALKEPVSVTYHGQDDLVVLSAEEFKRLKAFDTRRAFHPWELPEDAVQALENVEIPEDAAQFNHEYK